MGWKEKRQELINKLPTLLDLINHYALGEEKWALDKSPIRLLFPNHFYEGKFEAITMADGMARLVPLSLAFNDYYRGQSRYFPSSKPTLFRQGMNESKVFLERLKTCELELLVKQHPLTKIFLDGILYTCPDGTLIRIYFYVDVPALAQHYGIKTELLDLTIDKWVAAFFASTDYDPLTDTYQPVLDNERYGVFYHYVNTSLEPFSQKQLRAVGLQPFSRPGEQSGFVIELKATDNFNKQAEKIKFRHDPDISTFIYNYTNRGNHLFPYDILQDKAKTIRETDTFSVQSYLLTKARYYPDYSDSIIWNYLKEQNKKIVESPIVSFSKNEIDDFIQRWESQDKKRFLDKIVVRLTCSGE